MMAIALLPKVAHHSLASNQRLRPLQGKRLRARRGIFAQLLVVRLLLGRFRMGLGVIAFLGGALRAYDINAKLATTMSFAFALTGSLAI